MKIRVEFEMDEADKLADPSNDMGLTEDGYMMMLDVLELTFGADDVQIDKLGNKD